MVIEEVSHIMCAHFDLVPIRYAVGNCKCFDTVFS